MKTVTIRPSGKTDAAGIAKIYSCYVENTAITFEEESPTVEEMRERISQGIKRYPWLTAELDGRGVGFAYATAHRTRASYRWSVDVSVYLDQDFTGLGIGKQLYVQLFRILTIQGFVNAYAGIALPNEASLRLHQYFGFRPVGVYEHVGFKFGQWHDVGWWQKNLNPIRPSMDEPTWLESFPPESLKSLQDVVE